MIEIIFGLKKELKGESENFELIEFFRKWLDKVFLF